MSFNVSCFKDGRKQREFCRLARDARTIAERWEAEGGHDVKIMTSEGVTVSPEALRELERHDAPAPGERNRAA